METLAHLEDEPARVLVLGDSHGDLAMVRDAIRLARRRGADMVLSVGDFGFWPGTEGHQFLGAVDRTAVDASIPVAVVPGNHDDYELLDSLDPDDDGWLRPADWVLAAPRGHTWRMGGHWWLACGGAASIDGPDGVWPQQRGPVREGQPVTTFGFDGTPRRTRAPRDMNMGGWWPQEVVTDDDVERSVAAVDRLEAQGDRVSVLVTHDAPSQVTMQTDTPFPLGMESRDRLGRIAEAARPDLALFGHWHQHVRQPLPLGGEAVGLSADVNPASPQWCLVDVEPERTVTVDVPSPWAVRAHGLGTAADTGNRTSLGEVAELFGVDLDRL